ncbi:MAG: tRNA A64-2'-O-ribosylphosphate transferase [Linnemannia gamsii]|nr:MAG: tRNA A64-2'-O-ribosylphosphate transferase [Linnemannia gamsii]
MTISFKKHFNSPTNSFWQDAIVVFHCCKQQIILRVHVNLRFVLLLLQNIGTAVRLNRLRSIQADAAFVSEISDLFPQFPVIANERCGTWYVHPSKIHKPGVYFKSTDGHTGIWDFNLRRYNPHLITTIIKHGGCIIVDSTRKGKRVPDALSKTIPIWCTTINNAVRKCALQNQVDQEGGDAMEAAGRIKSNKENKNWDTRHHSLPSLISRSEHVQIADKIEGFAEKLMVSRIRFTDMTPLTTKLLKPIRPIWLTPQSFLLRHDLPDYSQVAFLPVICLSASRVVQDGMEERNGYLYVQGSGDDEEMWSRGLKPELFWENEDYLLEEGISAEECEQRAVEVVREAKRKLMEKSKHRQQQQLERKGKASAGKDGLVASEFGGGRIPDCWNSGFDMVINCGAEIRRHPLCEFYDNNEELSEKNYFYLHLPIAEGKKGQHQLLEMIPMAIKAVRQMFSASASSKDDTSREMARPRILVHCQQGMDRSVGITLALLVSCFDETTGAYGGGGDEGSTDVKTTATKEMIQRRLFQIMSHRLAARPSRATLKMVNTFFMSPTDPPPAKYKS